MSLYDFIELYLKIILYLVCVHLFLIKQVMSSLTFRSGASSVLINKYLLSFVILAKREGTYNLFYKFWWYEYLCFRFNFLKNGINKDWGICTLNQGVLCLKTLFFVYLRTLSCNFMRVFDEVNIWKLLFRFLLTASLRVVSKYLVYIGRRRKKCY